MYPSEYGLYFLCAFRHCLFNTTKTLHSDPPPRPYLPLTAGVNKVTVYPSDCGLYFLCAFRHCLLNTIPCLHSNTPPPRPYLPLTAGVNKVTVYPSDYGLQRMAEEQAAGPQVGVGSVSTNKAGSSRSVRGASWRGRARRGGGGAPAGAKGLCRDCGGRLADTAKDCCCCC